MSPNAAQIQQLVAEGDTENALHALSQWVQSQQQFDWVRQCVLVQARWEQLQRDLVAGVVDADDARQETNQINAAILDLLQPPATLPQVPTKPRSGISPLIWLPILGLFVLGGLVFYLWTDRPGSSAGAVASKTGGQAATSAPKNKIRWPKGQKTKVAVNSAVYTYEVLAAQLEDFNTEQNRLVLQVRCSSTYDYDANFWDDNFRFESADVPPIVASGGLNKIVPGHSFADGEVVFMLPKSIQKGDLRIGLKGEKTILPVEF